MVRLHRLAFGGAQERSTTANLNRLHDWECRHQPLFFAAWVDLENAPWEQPAAWRRGVKELWASGDNLRIEGLSYVALELPGNGL